jgi:hypothetical protein
VHVYIGYIPLPISSATYCGRGFPGAVFEGERGRLRTMLAVDHDSLSVSSRATKLPSGSRWDLTHVHTRMCQDLRITRTAEDGECRNGLFARLELVAED